MYLTQDQPAGLLYRFTPDAYPDLSAGTLEAAIVGDDGAVTWGEVSDPSGMNGVRTHDQVEGGTKFVGGEGIWYRDGVVVFTTKGDNKVHALDVEAQTYEVVYEGTEPLTGVDNITAESGTGDLYVAEDGGNMEVILISAEGDVVPFARVVEPGHEDSEVTGPAFNPAGDRLYFSSQRGPTPKTLVEMADIGAETNNGGRTYEITGPFRGIEAAADAETPSTATTLAAAGASGGDDDGVNPDGLLIIGVGAVAVAAAAAGVVAVRRRRAQNAAGDASEDAGGNASADESGAGAEPLTDE